jgi:acylphosphatase
MDSGLASKRHVRIFVSGRVQGVWFRASARERALALGLDGEARNLADGRVELHAEGTPDAIESFLAWCAEGPSGARVDEVKVEDQEPVGGPTGFRITR